MEITWHFSFANSRRCAIQWIMYRKISVFAWKKLNIPPRHDWFTVRNVVENWFQPNHFFASFFLSLFFFTFTDSRCICNYDHRHRLCSTYKCCYIYLSCPMHTGLNAVWHTFCCYYCPSSYLLIHWYHCLMFYHN